MPANGHRGVENDSFVELRCFSASFRSCPLCQYAHHDACELWGKIDVSNRQAPQALYDDTAGRASVAYSGTYRATAAHQVARGNAAGHKSKTRASAAAEPMSNLVFITPHRDQNELANSLKHEGVRVGEIIAYRAWRVIEPSWSQPGDDRLHSVFVRDYVWPPDEPASGDVRTHGIYSFRDVICAREEYGYSPLGSGPLLFGKVKIWGEIVEHEAGYRSQFGKIVSLDHGDPELLMKFRTIYRLNMSSFESSRIRETFQRPHGVSRLSDSDYGKLFGLSLTAVFVLILVLNAMALGLG